MLINGKNYLLLERRGCEYTAADMGRDDVNNYRVGSYDYSIKGKDGRRYILEFGAWDPRKLRTTNKRTGAPLKNPVYEVVKNNALYLSTQYEETEKDGFRSCWRNAPMERTINGRHLDYSKAGILEAVNEISADHYDDIMWIQAIELTRPARQNWTPASLINEWAKKNRRETFNRHGETMLKLYTGTYKYLCYSTPDGAKSSAEECRIIVYLERVAA